MENPKGLYVLLSENIVFIFPKLCKKKPERGLLFICFSYFSFPFLVRIIGQILFSFLLISRCDR